MTSRADLPARCAGRSNPNTGVFTYDPDHATAHSRHFRGVCFPKSSCTIFCGSLVANQSAALMGHLLDPWILPSVPLVRHVLDVRTPAIPALATAPFLLRRGTRRLL